MGPGGQEPPRVFPAFAQDLDGLAHGTQLLLVGVEWIGVGGPGCLEARATHVQ